MKLYISTGNSRMEKKWNGQEMEFSVFLERLSHTVRTSETMEQYRKLSKAKQDSIKDVGGFVLGKLKGGRRKKANVLFRSGLTLDMDYATEDIAEQIELFFDFRCLIYSTHKHTPEKPRLRLIIPLSRTVSPDEYAAVARKVAEDIGMELFDDTTYEPSRLMYWPSTSADGEFFFRDIPGTFLNPDSVLERYADWRDSSSWPVSSRQKAVVSREMKKQADPLSKEGIVGAFCRTYSIEEAIRIFLPDVYQESMMPERFDYIPADSQAGVVIYEGKFAYSHHATDPACGKLLNAFDIVRIHKFGEQDDKAEEGTDAGKLPSFKAMSDFAVSDEQVKRTLAKEREKAASEEFDTDTGEWQTMLDLDRQGKVKDTLSNIATIIRFDENLQPIVFNQLKNALDVIGELPWVQVKKGWGDADIACAKLYFERVYGIWSPTKFKDALLAVVSSERLYHPVKEYFSTLSWDGCSRIDSLLIDYMGAENTPYVRAVTRKTLVAAVARIYEPGIKFDSVLVLNGPQGCGKSTFFAKLGKEWYSDSLTISDMKDGKTAAEKLQGYWLLELGQRGQGKAVGLQQFPAGRAFIIARLFHAGCPAVFGGEVPAHVDERVQQHPVQLTQRARDPVAAGALEHGVVCFHPVEVAQGDFAVHDAARHFAVEVQRIRDIGNFLSLFVGVGDEHGVFVQLALGKAQAVKNAAVIQLIPHYHIGQKGTAFQCLRGGEHLPPHMQILLLNGLQRFVHLPVIAHGHLGTGVLHRRVELFAEVRRDGVVRVHKGHPLAPGGVQPGEQQ